MDVAISVKVRTSLPSPAVMLESEAAAEKLKVSAEAPPSIVDVCAPAIINESVPSSA